MRKQFLLSLLLAFMLVGCGSTTTSSDGGSHDSSEDDFNNNYDSTNTSTAITVHNQGVACAICHGATGSEHSFLSGGTVFNSLNATSANLAASGYSIRVALEGSINVDYRIKTKRGSGNSYSSDPSLSSAYNFTGQVLDNTGAVVNASGLNTHNTRTHLDCNSCHTATGANNAPGRITSFTGTTSSTTGTTTGTGVSTGSTVVAGIFQADVLPIIAANCSTTACHNGTAGTTALYDANVTLAHTNITSKISTAGTAVTGAQADASLLLTRAVGTGHSGGTILVPTETRYITIRDWIISGALIGDINTTAITAPTTVAAAPSFATDVYPIFTSKCTACHTSSAVSAFVSTTAAQAYSSIIAGLSNTTTPASSRLLQKATNTISHNGGQVFTATSVEYKTIENWMSSTGSNAANN